MATPTGAQRPCMSPKRPVRVGAEDGMLGDIRDGAGGWEALEVVFGVLGRVVLVLDADFDIVRASRELDGMVCDGASHKALGRPVADLLGEQHFAPGAPLRRTLEEQGVEEGRRAFLRCPHEGARLVSLSAAWLPPELRDSCDVRARYVLVLRPAETDAHILQSATASMGLVAESRSMRAIVYLIEQLHRSEASVLITGESGTGKEVVARALHASSPRADGPFVAVNTAAIPAELLESELFGHVKGAFTGASANRVGRFELAAGGTLFLDEIGDMPGPLQVKLLRVLQERTYERLGESTSRSMDARIIAATNADLAERVRRGDFREDLYYRLRVVPIDLPPLRERRDDIAPLVRHHLARICSRQGRALRLSPDALRTLESCSWPGNVRQLENALEYAVALCPGQTLEVHHLPPDSAVRTPQRAEPPRATWADSPAPPSPLARPQALTEADETSLIRQALDSHRWNRSKAAEALGLSRTTLWRRMRELRIA